MPIRSILQLLNHDVIRPSYLHNALIFLEYSLIFIIKIPTFTHVPPNPHLEPTGDGFTKSAIPTLAPNYEHA